MTQLAPPSATTATTPPADEPARSIRQSLSGKISARTCVLGWILASLLFLVFATLGGYPAQVDAQESLYSTWTIAHGDFDCAFPSVTPPHEPLIAPVYPLLSGGVAAVTGIGHATTFPSQAAMGPRCNNADYVIKHWAFRSGAALATRAISLLGWFVLLAGIVAWLRATGRGRTGWEPATLLVVAVLPTVSSCVGEYFHPQDLMALGFGLVAAACALRRQWAAAGALIALAVLTQQFALLIAAPLLVLAPRERRARYVGAAAATAVLLVGPLYVLSGGNVVRAITLGSGDNPSIGGTMMWELSHSGAVVVFGSRILPIVLALALTWWAVRRLGPAASSPVALMSILATSLSLRLVLEQNIFEYYFMALVVTLILLEVTRGRIRGSVLAWLVTLTMAWSVNGYMSKLTSGLHIRPIVSPLVLLCAAGLAVYGKVRGRKWQRWNVWLWTAVAVCAVLTWPGVFSPLPAWIVQPVFVLTGAALAVTPLLEEARAVGPRSSPFVPAPATA